MSNDTRAAFEVLAAAYQLQEGQERADAMRWFMLGHSYADNAVPDLLDALQRAANSAGFQYMTYETQEAINAAIAKATGEANEQ